MRNNKNIQAFKRWVVRYKNFAIALPLVVVLTSFFVVENIKDFRGTDTGDRTPGNGLNLELPGEEPNLDIKDNGELRLEEVKDYPTEKGTADPTPSLENERKSEKDSLQQILEQLEALSFDGPKDVGRPSASSLQNNRVRETEKSLSQEEQNRKLVEDRLAYREMLREGKEKIAGSNGKLPTRENNETTLSGGTHVFRAAVYRDQFILPDDNVELILLEDMAYKGRLFKKNTFIYAVTSIQGNRVLLDIDNINHVPLDIVVKDYRDGREGIYSKRAGELWREFKAEAENGILSNAANEIPRGSNGIVQEMVREVGSFLRNKKLRERDKILLVNDHEVLLLVE